MQVLSKEHDSVLAGAGLNQSLLPSGLPDLKKQKGGTALTSLGGTSWAVVSDKPSSLAPVSQSSLVVILSQLFPLVTEM